jgi:hypothetical protein
MGGKVGRGVDPGHCGKGIFTADAENTLYTFMQFRVAFRNLHFKVASEPCRMVVGGSREVLFLLYGSCLPNS